MNKLLVFLTAILLSTVSNGQAKGVISSDTLYWHGQTANEILHGIKLLVRNDTLYANLQPYYDILQALAKYHNLQLELTRPMKVYKERYTVIVELKNLSIPLKVFSAAMGMDHTVEGNKLIVGRRENPTN